VLPKWMLVEQDAVEACFEYKPASATKAALIPEFYVRAEESA
jgi:hypothetical protein